MRIEEIEVYEWDSLDAIKEKAEVIEEVGNLDLFSSPDAPMTRR